MESLKLVSSCVRLVEKLMDVLEQIEKDRRRWEYMMRAVAIHLEMDFATIKKFHQVPDPDDERNILHEFGECIDDALNALKDQPPK